jgi:transcriptional regulator with XRE-family HTH domain
MSRGEGTAAIIDAMPAGDDRTEHARRRARHFRTQLGDEIRNARLDAGLSQATVGAAADMSHAQLGRIERAALRDLTFDQASRAAAAVGLRLFARTYPDGDPVRDAAQLALLERFRTRLPPGTRWRTAAPLPIPGDRRAWDGVAERDGDVDMVILVVADTDANRRAIEAHRAALRARFPLDSRDVLEALRAGRLPDQGGIVIP